MKNLANIWVIAMAIMGFTFVSCTTDDDIFGDGPFRYEEKSDTTTPTDTDTDWHVDWNTDMQLRFGYRMEEYTFDWPSDMVVHMTNYKNNTSKDTTYVHACPMSAQMQGPTLVWSDSLTTTKFNGITLLSEDATAWLPEDAKEQEKLNTFRWEVDMNSFKDTITSTLVEARIMLDGKYVNFKKGSKPNPSRRSAEPKMGNDTTINGKLYSQEIVDVVINCELHKSYPVKYVSYTTKVLREKVEEKEPTTVTADYSAPGLQRFLSASRVWNEDKRLYDDVYSFECSNEYFFVVVDFHYDNKKDHEEMGDAYTISVPKNEVYPNEKYASKEQGCAVYNHGSFLPAIYSWNSTGFAVVGALSNRTEVKQDIFDTDAVNRGIKNMKKENNAKPTPIIQATCTPGNNGIWTVAAKTDGHSISFTIMSK